MLHLKRYICICIDMEKSEILICLPFRDRSNRAYALKNTFTVDQLGREGTVTEFRSFSPYTSKFKRRFSPLPLAFSLSLSLSSFSFFFSLFDDDYVCNRLAFSLPHALLNWQSCETFPNLLLLLATMTSVK